MTGISSKVAASTIATAIVGVIVYVLSLFGIIVPADVIGFGTVIIVGLVGFFTPEIAKLEGSSSVSTSSEAPALTPAVVEAATVTPPEAS